MNYRTFSPQTVTSNNNEATYWRYWGKARHTNEHGAQYHLLPYHCLDMIAVKKCGSDLRCKPYGISPIHLAEVEIF